MKKINLTLFLISAITFFPVETFAESPIADNGFSYAHDPTENEKAIRDAEVASNTVYGFKPTATGTISAYSESDFTNADLVANSRAERIQYHDYVTWRLEELRLDTTLTSEEKARQAVMIRNKARENAYIDENGNITNQAGYNLAVERTKKYTYEYFVAKGLTDEEIIESAYSTNAGMDACLGLYDEYFTSYDILLRPSILASLNDEQDENYNRLYKMYHGLSVYQREAMSSLYFMDINTLDELFDEVNINAAPEVMSLIQRNDLIDRLVTKRFDEDFGNNFWINYNKNWGDMRQGNYHSSGISGGYEWNKNNLRYGVLVSYNATNYGADKTHADIHDTRLGFYINQEKDVNNYYFYVDYGIQRNKLRRSLSTLNLEAEANYKSKILEFGAGYSRSLQPEKIWNVSPYLKLQASHLRNPAFEEDGAGIFNHYVNSKNNWYCGAQAGIELGRNFEKGKFAITLGINQSLSGADPNLKFSYAGDLTNEYTLRNKQDKTHFVLGITGENEFSDGWTIGGNARLQKSVHDKDLFISLRLNKIW